MAGALSGHILDSYHSRNLHSTGPFGLPLTPSFNNNTANRWPTGSISNDIVTSGAMSFDPNMHGNSSPMNLVTDLSEDDTSFMNLSKATAMKIASLQAKLNQQLGPEYISTRPGPGGGPKLVYAEGWKIINLANEVFGFNGWSSNLVSLTTDFIDYNEESRRYSVGVTAVIRVTLRDGVFHEDVGYGVLENSKTKGPALDKCKKEAVTDGLKRALRNFGNLLGNCLYDKQYTNEIVKVKVSPPKFDKENLHRRSEFSQNNASSSSSSKPTASSSTLSSSSTTNSTTKPSTTPVIKSEPLAQQTNLPSKPLSSVPPHVREQVRSSEAAACSSSSSTSATPASKPSPAPRNISTPAAPSTNRGSAARTAAILHGLGTPITPANPPLNQQPHQPPQQGQGTSNRSVTFADSPLAPRANFAPAPKSASATARPDDSFGANNDDSFTFGSDDDAFFAAVDLGEGDMGRPLDLEEGLGGRAVGESQSSTSFCDNSMLGIKPEPPAQAQAAPAVASSSSSSNRTSASTGAGTSTSSGSVPSRNAPQPSRNQQQQQQQSSSAHPNPPPEAQRSAFNPQRISGGQSTDGTNQHQHPGPGSGTGSSSASGGFEAGIKANSTPAPRRMGGFSFPPEMLNKQSPHMHTPQGIGMKRPADAMRSSANNNQAHTSRRLAPGMGLMSAQGGGSTRQQMNTQGMGLDREDGGDAKRMRR